MNICIDFDGTIVDHRFPDIGAPVPGAIDWMRKWADNGARLILWTMRSGDTLTEAVAYLNSHGILLHGINENPGQESWSASPKAYAPVYLDDAAFGCPMIHPESFERPCVDWSIAGPAIAKMLP